MAGIELTILLATRNGAKVLPRVLSAYGALEPVACRWQLIVVDNGSSDGTASILRSFQRDLPLDILEVAAPGKNRALNRGLSAVEGDFVVLTDDDAVPCPSFVAAWVRCAKAQADYDLFGGTIDLSFDIEPPHWLMRNQKGIEMMFARRDLRDGPTSWDNIYGPNMAVRRRVFEAGFRFNEDVGPNGADPFYRMGSESEFCRRVSESGAASWFAQEPKILHIVRANQMRPSYWAARAYRSGKGRAFLALTDPSPQAEARRSKIAGQRLGGEWLKAISPFPAHRFDSLCRRNFVRGYRDELRRHAGLGPAATSVDRAG